MNNARIEAGIRKRVNLCGFVYQNVDHSYGLRNVCFLSSDPFFFFFF